MALGMPPRVTQRSQMCRSSQVSSSRGLLSRAYSPAGVSGGKRPSGGSTSSDVRFVGVPRSIQKLLYAPTLPPATVRRGAASRSCSSRSAASACRWVVSSSVRVVRPSYSSGRSMGTAPDECQTPCRSGSPQAVRGAMPWDCAAANAGASSSAPITVHAVRYGYRI